MAFPAHIKDFTQFGYLVLRCKTCDKEPISFDFSTKGKKLTDAVNKWLKAHHAKCGDAKN